MGKPNILFVFADQLRYHALGSSGNEIVKTPNLDRMAGKGIVFNNSFSNCPVCSPYRGLILTGLYPHQNGVVDNAYMLRNDVETFPQVLKKNGYRTGFVGKWHLGDGPYTEGKRYGFDYMAAYNCQGADYFNMSYHENENGPIKFDGWEPEAGTTLTIRFIERHLEMCENAPFALFLGWAPPHWPYDSYPEEYDIYDPDKVDIRPNVPLQLADYARKEISDYYGNISALDAQIGRLSDALKELGIDRETIFCFSSDHGDHIRSHGFGTPMDMWNHPVMRASKMSPYDESIHIPFILSYPEKVRSGIRTDALFSSVDVMPTLLSLCGIEKKTRISGSDLSHAVLGGKGSEPDSVYLQILGHACPDRMKGLGYWRGIRTMKWLYARWYFNSYGPVLFDLENDPFEMKNLFYDQKYSEVVSKLESKLKEWMAKTKDPFDMGERDSIGMLKLGQKFASSYWDKINYIH